MGVGVFAVVVVVVVVVVCLLLLFLLFVVVAVVVAAVVVVAVVDVFVGVAVVAIGVCSCCWYVVVLLPTNYSHLSSPLRDATVIPTPRSAALRVCLLLLLALFSTK